MPKVRSESNGLFERMCLLETGIYSVFWNEILERVNATSRKLQDPTLDLNAAVAMVVSLKRFVEAKRETFTEYERHGATLKPGVHTNDFAPIYGRRAMKLGHASLATVFRHGRLTFQPILWENLESPVLMYQPITRWLH